MASLGGWFEVALIFMLVALSLGLGAAITVHDLKAVMRHPRAFLLGLVLQFLIMPLLSFTLAKAFALPPAIAVGLILVGVCPGGPASNLFAYWSKGNVALSIALTGACTMLSLVLLPLLLALYTLSYVENSFVMPYFGILAVLAVELVPCGIGMWIRHKHAAYAPRVEQIGSSLGGAFVLLSIIFGLIENPHIWVADPAVWGAAFLLEPLGLLAAYAVCRAAGATPPETRTVAFEVGLQNVSLAITMASLAFAGDIGIRRQVLTYPLLYSLFIMPTSGAITAYFRAYEAPRDPASPFDEIDEDVEGVPSVISPHSSTAGSVAHTPTKPHAANRATWWQRTRLDTMDRLVGAASYFGVGAKKHQAIQDNGDDIESARRRPASLASKADEPGVTESVASPVTAA